PAVAVGNRRPHLFEAVGEETRLDGAAEGANGHANAFLLVGDQADARRKIQPPLHVELRPGPFQRGAVAAQGLREYLVEGYVLSLEVERYRVVLFFSLGGRVGFRHGRRAGSGRRGGERGPRHQVAVSLRLCEVAAPPVDPDLAV